MQFYTPMILFLLVLSQSIYADRGTSATGEIVDEVVKATGDAVEKKIDEEIEERTGYKRSDDDDEREDKGKGHKDKKSKKDKKSSGKDYDANRHGQEISAQASEDGREFGQSTSESVREDNDRESDNEKIEKRWWEFWK